MIRILVLFVFFFVFGLDKVSARCLELHQDSYDYNVVVQDPGTVIFPQEDVHLIIPCETKIKPQRVLETPFPSFVRGIVFSSEVKEEPKIVKEKQFTSIKEERFLVYFPFNKWKLTSDQLKFLKSKLSEIKEKFLKEGLNITEVEVIGHACCIGSKKYNKVLSEKRAKVVEDIVKKVLGGEVKVKSYGAGVSKESGVLCLNRNVVVIVRGES